VTSELLRLMGVAVTLIEALDRVIEVQKLSGEIPPEMLDRVDRERKDATRRFLEMARRDAADLEDDVDPAGR
jgi:uncharacterized protein YqeY